MGISDLLPYLKEKAPGAFSQISIMKFAGYRVAFDAASWFRTYLSVAHKNVVLRTVNPVDEDPSLEETLFQVRDEWIKFNKDYLRFGITPVWVLDGKALPDKAEKQAKTRADSEKRAVEAAQMREELRAVPLLLRTAQAVKAYKDKLVYVSPYNRDMMNEFANMIAGLGFPCIRANHEGEILCAEMAVEGLVVAMWSHDTDPLVVGAPILINEYKGRGQFQEPVASVILTPVIHSSLKMNREQFRDQCIFFGCDFNKRIPGIGVKRAQEHFTKNDMSLEKFEASTGLAVDNLRFRRCREIFGPNPTGLTNDSPSICMNVQSFIDNGRAILQQYRLGDHHDMLLSCMKCVKTPRPVVFNGAQQTEVEPPPPKLKIVEPAQAKVIATLTEQLAALRAQPQQVVVAPTGGAPVVGLNQVLTLV